MQVQQVGDITFVKGWQQPQSYNALFKELPAPPAQPTKEYYDAFFPKLDSLIKTPVAFCIIAPLGWTGERCWFESDKIGAYGWEPVFWKESTHVDKTWVQLHMKLFPKNADLKEAPPAPKAATSVAYDYLKGQRYGDLPYLGCSSILTSIEDGKVRISIPKVGMYGKVESDKCLHFMRVARPMSLANIALLKAEGFSRLKMLKFNQYWVRGKTGLGSKELCEY